MTKPATKTPKQTGKTPATPSDGATDPIWGDLFAEMVGNGLPTGLTATSSPREPTADTTPVVKPKTPGRQRRPR